MTTNNKTQVLHEILAVVGGLKATKEKIKDEAEATFVKKVAIFEGKHRSLKMFDDDRQAENTEEHQEITSTVIDKLEYIQEHFTRFWDAKLQKETGNCFAKSDIIVDGVTIATEVPVSFLLEMEYELTTLRDIYAKTPTLAPGIKWVKDPDTGKDIWKDENPVQDQKTEKSLEYKVVAPATPQHPAQVREWTESKVVGLYTTTRWSGMISSAQKSVFLERIDKLIRAVKKARQRANGTEIKPVHIAKSLFNYIHATNF